MKELFSKVGSLIDTNYRSIIKEDEPPKLDLSNGIWYSVKIDNTEEVVTFVSTKKLLFGDKIKITISLDNFGEYICNHVMKDKFLNTTVNLIGFKENEIGLTNLREDSKELVRQLSDYDNKFNLDIEVVC